MIYQLILEDSPEGVRMTVYERRNDITDNPAMSLSAMWMARFYTELELAHGKGHAYIHKDTDGNRKLSFH